MEGCPRHGPKSTGFSFTLESGWWEQSDANGMSEVVQGIIRDLPGTDPTPETSPTDVSVFRPERMEHLLESPDANQSERDSEQALCGNSRQPIHSERSEGPGVPERVDLPGDAAGLHQDGPWDDEWFLLDCYRGRAPNYFDGRGDYRENPGRQMSIPSEVGLLSRCTTMSGAYVARKNLHSGDGSPPVDRETVQGLPQSSNGQIEFVNSS